VSFFAVEGLIDHIAGFLQRVGKLAVEVDVVFDHENTHETVLKITAGPAAV
jgi:hypothetical protein